MAVNTSKTVDPKEKPEKPQVKLPLVIAAVALLVIYLGWLGHRIFGPPPPPHTAAMQKYEEFMKRVAHEAGPDADLSKVNPTDREAFIKRYTGAPISPDAALKSYIKGYGWK